MTQSAARAGLGCVDRKPLVASSRVKSGVSARISVASQVAECQDQIFIRTTSPLDRPRVEHKKGILPNTDGRKQLSLK